MSKKSKPKLNVKLLRKIQKVILANPSHFHMGNWSGMKVDHRTNIGEFRELASSWKKDGLQEPCGTTACIAGWAVALATDKEIGKAEVNYNYGIDSNIKYISPALLGIEVELDEDGDQIDGMVEELFYTSNWPLEFQEAYEVAKANYDYPGMAKAASDRIDAFIAQYAPEEVAA